MKTFKNQAAQGDVLFTRVDKIPADAVLSEVKGPTIVAESETHHHHQFNDPSVKFYTTKDPLTCYLYLDHAAPLTHERSFDTHEAILFPPGMYQVRRQKERAYTPEGWRRVED